MQIAILGRQPKISLAELESLYGAKEIIPIASYAAIVKSGTPLPQARLGGTIKSARVLARLQKTDLAGAFDYLQQTIPEHLQYLPEGKLQLGISVYGFLAKRDWLLKQTLGLKKIIKATGRSVRIIENKTEALEAAQVLYNKLTGPLGWELLLIKEDEDIILAQTTAVQDIDAYAARDFERPKRDAYVGMLPPKLAQIMINLTHPQTSTTILDPFCGTGVVLQEAMLMKFAVYGSDVSERMIRYSRDNLNWLQEVHKITSSWYLEAADATTHRWRSPVEAVVCETYLGKPLTTLPSPKMLEEITREADDIAESFLQNIASQLKSGARLCLALPAWYLGDGAFQHLPVLDQLADMGYNRLDLVHAKQSELIYHRPDQVVARELTILVRS